MNNEFKLKNGSGCLYCKGCGRQDKQLNTYDWLADIPGNAEEQEMVEVQFKNTRKGYFKNSNKLKLDKGDIVAVEASPGHDIGVVTLTGRLVPLQMRKANLKPDVEIKRIYRKVKPVDMEKYEEAKAKEHDTMIRSRQIALNLNLNMKIGDVEYQGDGNKAIFYYIADERVDFRQLIKVLAETFRVRIEMKQIGARQEAGRIGGIGPCGRELCCATWMTNFVSVSTSAARYQDISLNPQKLAGQCAKLKCCLNYEVDAYVEAQKRLPSKEITLETVDGTFYFFKADILKGSITYSTDKNFMANIVTIPARRAFEIINMNRRGEKPENLLETIKKNEPQQPVDLVEQESLTRFDKRKGNNNNRKKKRKGETNGNNEGTTNGNKPQQLKDNQPKGVRCPMELSTYFRINAANTGQFERTLIVADDEAYVSYLEGCTAPMRDENQLHAAIVEIVANERAEVKYSTVQNWYPGDKEGKGGIYNFVTKRGLCKGEGSKISWTQVETGSAITWKYPSCILAGDNSVGEFYSVAVTNNYQQADTGTKMIHLGKNTKSTIVSKGISAGHSQNSYRGLVKVSARAEGARNHSQCDSLLLSSTCGAHTFPYADIQNETAIVEHEATTSKISEEQLFYCQQRGISVEEAVGLIVNGYAREVMNKLPMEFAVEAQKLLTISLEGSVG